MISKNLKKIFSVVLGLAFVTSSSQMAYGYQSLTPPPADDNGSPSEAAPLAATELQSLVAPIALYPDSLVAQVLSAATFPDQVAIADYWVTE